MRAGAWMRANLSTEGYCVSDAERRELWLGLRFSIGLCLALVVTALALESLALSGVGVVVGSTARHLRPSVEITPSGTRSEVRRCHPTRRAASTRLSWRPCGLLVVGALLSADATTAGLVLGGLLVGACATVTAKNLCLPSEALAWWERRSTSNEAITTT